MKVMNYVSSQLRQPRGLVGLLACRMMNAANNRMYQSLAALVRGDENTKILEIGYGNGHLVQMLYRKTGAQICGIDISEDMRQSAVKRNQKAVEAGRVRLELGDCCQLAYEPDTFDYVVTMNTVYFWSDVTQGLKEIRRTLKDGGIFYNVVYTKDSLEKLPYTREGFRLYEKADFREFGRQAGFSKVAFKEMGEILIVRYIK